MAEMVKFHGQVVAISGTAATIDDDSTVVSDGITDTGGITTNTDLTITGNSNGVILYDEAGNAVRLSVATLNGSNMVVLTRV